MEHLDGSVGPRRWKVEVFERPGGTGVGTSVQVCSTLTDALTYVAATLGNHWSGGWQITASDGTILIAESLDHEPTVIAGNDNGA